MWPGTPGTAPDDGREQALDLEKGRCCSRNASPMINPSGRHRLSLSPDTASDTRTWMALLDDDTPVSALTLPGTHDSAAYTIAWPFVQTQKLSIAEQLDAGIRYLDLRCGLRDNHLEMVHGPSLLGLTFQRVLDVIHDWLTVHSTEGLVVQIKEDRTAERSDVAFAQAVAQCLATKSECWLTANETPTLGELRGKVQLFRRFDGPNLGAYGIDVTGWVDNPRRPFTIRTSHGVQITIQDHYNFNDPRPLSSLILEKGGNVSGLLEQAADDDDDAHWYMNFTSAYEFNLWHQLTPREVAVGGYSGFHWEDGVNPRLRQFLHNLDRPARYGIVVMDFPEYGGSDLIELLVLSNFSSKTGHSSTILWIVALFLLAFAFALVLIYGVHGHWKMPGFVIGFVHC